MHQSVVTEFKELKQIYKFKNGNIRRENPNYNTLNSDFFIVINDETKKEKSNSLMLDNEYPCLIELAYRYFENK